MAVKKHGVHFDITAENATDQALRAVENNLNRVNKAGDAIGRTLRGAFIATAAISAGKAFATAAIEAEQAQARLNAVIKATGGVAGMAAREINDMADAMAESTQFDDESLRNGAAQLIKFGTIHGDTFRGAMKLSADLAAFMGTDFTSAVQSVGKALHSPTEGLTALEKQIGKIDPVTKRWIERLMDEGRAYEAQGKILQILKERVGGTAEEMNTGLAKAANNVKKAWDEMLESMGKSSAVQGTTGGVLLVVENYLKNIKDVVENGDWVEKALAVAALAGGAGGHRPFNLSKRGPAAGQLASGRIGGPSPQADPAQAAMGVEMMEGPVKTWREMRRKLDEENKRAREKHLRDAEDGAEKQLEWEEMAANDAREAWEFYTKGRLEQEEQVRKAREDGLKAWFETIDREQEEAIRAGEEYLESERDRKEALKESEQAARDLGLTFSSAFEDAVLDGKKLSDVLRGLAKDVARIFLRKTVSEPLANAAAGFFKDIFRADGGPVSAGEPYIVGERGPELMVPGASGAVVPNHALRGGGSGQTINIYPDLRGASQEAVEALHRMVIDLRAQVPGMALGAYAQARTRGRL